MPIVYRILRQKRMSFGSNAQRIVFLQDRQSLRLAYPAFALLAVFGALGLWFCAQFNTAVNSDVAWLMIAAGRLLDGGRYVTDFYEGNPPLCILLYAPFVLLARVTGLPLYETPCLIGVTTMLASAGALYALLRRWPDLSRRSVVVATVSYLLGSAYLVPPFFFAERDQFVALGLLPFAALQLMITREVALPRRLAWPVLAFGAAAILIKPQFGLLPILLLAHRAVRRPKAGLILRDADFVILTVSTLLYGLGIAVFFSDYAGQVFPDFVGLYLTEHQTGALLPTMMPTLLGTLLLLGFSGAAIEAGPRLAVRLCGAAALLCLGLYLVQFKAAYYHLVPARLFLGTGSGLLLYALSGRALRADEARAALTIAVLVAVYTTTYAWGQTRLTHAAYRQLPLTRFAWTAGDGRSFFVFGEGMEMIHQAGLYAGVPYGSRFAYLWWLDGFLAGRAAPDKIAGYAAYLAEDLHRYRPSVMAIDVNIPLASGHYFDLIDDFSRYPAFRAEMAHYRRAGEMRDNRRAYFTGTPGDYDHIILYDLYRRID